MSAGSPADVVAEVIEAMFSIADEDADLRELVDGFCSSDAAAQADLESLLCGMSGGSFADAGVMTNDAGLVLRLADGSEFQISVVQSKEGSS